MNYDLLMTIVGCVTAACTTVGSMLSNGGKPSAQAILLSVIAVVAGYFTNKGNNAPKPPAVLTGSGTPPANSGSIRRRAIQLLRAGSGTPPANSGSIGKSSTFAAFALAVVAVVALFTAACSWGPTLAQSLIAAETGINVADPAVGAQVQKYFAAAITAAENWKTGTPTAELEEALTVLAGNLDLLPTGTTADNDIAAAINFIDNEIAIWQKGKAAKLELKSPAEQEVVFAGWINSTEGISGPNGRKHVWTGKPIKTPAQLKKALKKK